MINYKEYKTILSSKNNMNIYRGCIHGCIYCDSRSEIYGMTDTFENIEVKTNSVELLDEALSKKRNKCMITTGAMTDPYIPLKKELMNTRKCLEVIEKHGFGISVLTKSDLVFRDIDILDYCKQAKVTALLTFGIGMTLRYRNSEYYFKKLEEHFPKLMKEYMKKYGSSYAIKSPNSQKLTRIIGKFCKDNDIVYGEKEVFRFCTLFPEQNNQLSIFDEYQ